MEIEFGSQGTEDIFDGFSTKAANKTLPNNLHGAARRKLVWMIEATRLEDLKMPPGNRLEKLKGDLAGFHSIRINDQFRIVFRANKFQFTDVSIMDYH